MRTAIPLTVLATALACSLVSAPAHARARVFVASYGNDANPCTFLSPCRNFQAAVNAVDAGGEVTAIDSAGFGPIDIVKAVTITIWCRGRCRSGCGRQCHRHQRKSERRNCATGTDA